MAERKKPVHIIADSRESRNNIAERLAEIEGVTVEQRDLASGDFIICPGCVVERKSASDFMKYHSGQKSLSCRSFGEVFGARFTGSWRFYG